jgi:single-stranded-DNA-specific exonuclease
VPRYRWIEPVPINPADGLTHSGLVGEILSNRGVRTESDQRTMLSCDLDAIPDPATLPDIERAADLINQAITDRSRIGVYGDYDVDGVTSTALMVRGLEALNAEVKPFLPHRERDGYGLNRDSVKQAFDSGCVLLIAVDCGTSDRDELQYARDLGMRTVVIDHHHVPPALPPCDAFVSPRRQDSLHPFADYAAVGVVYQVLRYLSDNEALESLLPLAALGTVADVVPLVGANRAIVHHGLDDFDRFTGPGLWAIAQESGVKLDEVKSQHLAFMIGPRINAAGRIDDPWVALELLLTDHRDRAAELAHRLGRLNRQRQQMLDQYVAEANRYVEDDGKSGNPVVVVADPDWRVGLVGLIASRLCEQMGRPVFALNQTSTYSRGSARSIDEFNVVEALHRCADLLDKFGGHSKAAGLTIETNNIHEFDDRINQIFVDSVGSEPPLPALRLDAELRPESVSLELVDELKDLEPCGHGNPAPRFLMRDVQPFDLRQVGENRHLRFKVRSGSGAALGAISFGSGDRLREIASMPRVDLALSLRPNTFRGQKTVDLEVVDFREVR